MITATTKQLLSVMGCSAALTVTSAFSQVPGSQTDDPLRRPVQPAKPPAKGMVTVAPPAAPPAPAAEEAEATINVTSFRFSGNASLSEAVLMPLVAGEAGKPMTLTQLRDVAQKVQSFYRAKGWFLAQAYIPAQTPRNGVVEIAVLEGRVGQVTVNVADGTPITQSYASALANRFLQGGDLITENGLETPLLLLRDVPRVDAKAVIDPGAAVGSANVVINVLTEPNSPVVSGRVELDNYGNRVSGTTRIGAEVNVNNPFGFGDQLSVRGLRAIRSDDGGNNFGRIGYTVLAGPLGTRLGVSAARLGYELGGDFAVLGPNGLANVFSASVVQPLVRRKDENMFAELVVEHKKLTDRIEKPTFSEEERTLSSVRLQLNGDLIDRWAGLNVYTVSATRGRSRINDPVRLGFDQASDGPNTAGNFTKALYAFERLQQFSPSLYGKLSVSGQVANRNLHSAEKFAIGGESTVRAFPVGSIVGDQGYTATAEMRWAIPALQVARFTVMNTLFYDVGRVTVNHDNSRLNDEINSRRISGYGVGLNIGYAERTQLRLSAAWPRDSEVNVAVKAGARVWGQLSYRF
jgi:hemolysin activation/secretion protein